MAVDAEQLIDLDQRFSALDRLDYFQLLKLEPSATPEDIKRAFYRESRAFHPDKFFQLGDPLLKSRVHALYKRITEAYHVLRDDTRRRRYAADVAGPERAGKLRYQEVSEAETRMAARRDAEEAIGTNPKARQFYQAASNDISAEKWASAERNLKMALTYEPQNALYKEKLAEVLARIREAAGR